MKTYTQEEINVILATHRVWLDTAGESGERADLSRAGLRWAKLYRAEIRGANLCVADLSRADLRWANLSGSDLRGANLSGSDLRGAVLDPTAPIVPDLHVRVAEAVGDGSALDMRDWHGDCGTTHYRAGWAITLAGEAGAQLEEAVGPSAAGALIYAVSTGGPVPDFHVSNEAALADIRRCARSEQMKTRRIAKFDGEVSNG